MFKGQYVYSQLISLVSRYEFNKCVSRYKGNHRARNFTCWQQFLMLIFGQLSGRESLRDIVTCLAAHQNKTYHLGISKVVNLSTLSRANENRNYRIWKDFAQHLIQDYKSSYQDENNLDFNVKGKVYALDASVIDLCLAVFPWAKFRKTKGAIKLHTLLDLKDEIPVFINITAGKVHDVKALNWIRFEPEAFYILDKGYYDFCRLYRLNEQQAFFVIRAKKNLKDRRLYSQAVDKTKGIKYDQTIKLTGPKSSKHYPDKLRKIKYYDKELDKIFIFLTNHFDLDAFTITRLYKNRWQIELFFKWIKQHLKIKRFWGHSSNAVKTQIWVAICTYLLVAIAKKKCNSELSLYKILQILSVSAFDKTPLNQLLMNHQLQNSENVDCNDLILFDL